MDENKQILSDLDVAHNALQHLKIEPTKDNMTSILFVLQTLETAYKLLSMPKKEEGKEENA